MERTTADQRNGGGPAANPGRPADAGESDLAAVIGKLQRAHQARSFSGMRECFHDEARIESVAAGKVLGPDETVEAILAALDDGVYSMSPWTTEELRAGATLSRAGVRRRQDEAVTDGTIYWLVTGRDGLMWRVKLFTNRDDAVRHLELTGPTLGL